MLRHQRSLHKKKRVLQACTLLCLLFLFNKGVGQKQNKPISPLSAGRGKITYNPDTLGNRILDFSFCGYKASEKPIPFVAAKATVPLVKGDATRIIQAAINHVASLPLDENGFRGAVVLQKGTYTVYGQLLINASGIVLRGSGASSNGTVLLGAGEDRQTLIKIAGSNDKKISNPIRISSAYVPVNATTFAVENSVEFKIGDAVSIHRPSTLAWIKTLGVETFGGGLSTLGWKPGERDIFWERKIVAINKNEITVDVPITTALDSTYGGGTIAHVSHPGRIENIGVENLSLTSTYDVSNLKDEAHRWMAITLESTRDAWVRQVNFKHFAGSAVNVLASASRITVEDCKSLAPVSEIGGQRRYTFLTTGQQTLFQRCYAENGYHDFAVGFCAPGPNAFIQCQSVMPFSFSGTIDSWASGVLFDVVNIEGNALRFGNREQDGQGAGWSAANSVFWQCTAAKIDCYKPPTAQNYAFGSWAQFGGNGYWESSNEHVNPRSLFYAQLSDRLGAATPPAQLLPIDSEASSSPPVEVAMALTAKSVKAAPLLSDWIDGAASRNPISSSITGAKVIAVAPAEMRSANAPTMHISNGWLVRGNTVVTGKRYEVPWWNGSILPSDLSKMKPHITRFVPGKTGKGLTDDLSELTDTMLINNVVAIEHNYALWYDRRRDDHERIRRMDGEVWAPFYELPFKRSGKELAWDGLSKYDLTKYNPWYWNRLKQYADLADQKGLVLVHQNYMQHNIIEAGAHYADFPWRPVNNINNTGFPEPVPYAGDKRLFMAEQFYDLSNATRKSLHTAYIKKCLDNFKNNSGVIQTLSSEYTGPRHFAAFWLDVVAQWEKENKTKQIIALSTTKDVQDSILADPIRSKTVDLIDIRYWHIQADGDVYAPKGGQNLAPRQHARLMKPKATSFQQVYNAVYEYRTKYPGKAVMYSGDGYDQYGWAAFMAGGSMAAIPQMPPQFLAAASVMKPMPFTNNQYVLANDGKSYIVFNEGGNVSLNLKTGTYKAVWINIRNGKILKEEIIQGGTVQFERFQYSAVVLWLTAQ